MSQEFLQKILGPKNRVPKVLGQACPQLGMKAWNPAPGRRFLQDQPTGPGQTGPSTQTRPSSYRGITTICGLGTQEEKEIS